MAEHHAAQAAEERRGKGRDRMQRAFKNEIADIGEDQVVRQGETENAERQKNKDHPLAMLRYPVENHGDHDNIAS